MPRSGVTPHVGTATKTPTGQQLIAALLWLPYYLQWGALLTIVWPSQIGVIAGDRKELWNGIIIGAGAVVALVVPPVAGALSDRSTNPKGRRRPYLLWGGLLNVVVLLYLGTLDADASLTAFVFGSLALQFACNWWAGPYAGMIPDVLPPGTKGRASGYMMVMMAIGYGTGAAAAGALAREGSYGAIYAVLAGALAAALAVTLWLIREPPAASLAPTTRLRSSLRDFFPPLRQHADFYWIIATRVLVGMGMWGTSTYVLYYLQDIVHAEQPEQLSAMLFLTGGIIGVPLGMYAGILSDRIGRKRLVMLSGGLMAASAIIFCLAAADPAIWLLWMSAILFGIGNSMYSSVDWAFALDALPARGDAGKDMGIWHVALVLPHVIAMPISAVVLNGLKPVSLPFAYAAIFTIAAVWFVLGTVLVRRVRGID